MYQLQCVPLKTHPLLCFVIIHDVSLSSQVGVVNARFSGTHLYNSIKAQRCLKQKQLTSL